jgi:hypothetical protein
MDIRLALRIVVHVTAYFEGCDDGRNVGHNATDFMLIWDRDTLNLMDLTTDVVAKVSLGKNQGFNLSFFYKFTKCYTKLTYDVALMKAIDNYWDLRRLPVFVNFYDTVPMAFSQSLSLDNEAGASVDPLFLGYDDR